jgi:pimeloyl-ACP methyl ester carboxylesterase
MFCRLRIHRAGLKRRFLVIDDGNGATMLCYVEKGSKIPQQPSIVFIHGFSGDKSGWANIIKVSDIIYLCAKANISF